MGWEFYKGSYEDENEYIRFNVNELLDPLFTNAKIKPLQFLIDEYYLAGNSSKKNKESYLQKYFPFFAIAYNNLQFIKWYCRSKNFQPVRLIRDATSKGKFKILKWLWNNYGEATYLTEFEELDYYLLNDALGSDNLEVVKWVHNLGFCLEKNALFYLTKSRDIRIFEWVLKTAKQENTELETMDCIGDTFYRNLIRYGNLPILNYIYDNNLDKFLDTKMFWYAGYYSQFKLVKWLHYHYGWGFYAKLNVNVDVTRAINGVLNHLWCDGITVEDYVSMTFDLVKWLFARGYPLTQDSIQYAVYSRNHKCSIQPLLKFIHDNTFPNNAEKQKEFFKLNSQVIDELSEHGIPEDIEWLRSQGYPESE